MWDIKLKAIHQLIPIHEKILKTSDANLHNSKSFHLSLRLNFILPYEF